MTKNILPILIVVTLLVLAIFGLTSKRPSDSTPVSPVTDTTVVVDTTTVHDTVVTDSTETDSIEVVDFDSTHQTP